MVDPDRVRRLLQALRTYRDALAVRGAMHIDDYVGAEAFAGRYLVQAAAQVRIDIANHLVASEGWRVPADRLRRLRQVSRKIAQRRRLNRLKAPSRQGRAASRRRGESAGRRSCSWRSGLGGFSGRPRGLARRRRPECRSRAHRDRAAPGRPPRAPVAARTPALQQGRWSRRRAGDGAPSPGSAHRA